MSHQHVDRLTGASLARRRRRLKARAVAAAAHVQELRKALDRDDPIADERHDRPQNWVSRGAAKCFAMWR